MLGTLASLQERSRGLPPCVDIPPASSPHRRATEGLTEVLMRRRDAPSEIRQKEIILLIQQQVLRLQVAVDHVVVVQPAQRAQQLADVLARARLGEHPLRLSSQEFVELPARRIVHHEEDPVLRQPTTTALFA
jgi:hypothetical protein